MATIDRRSLLGAGLSMMTAATSVTAANSRQAPKTVPRLRRIATEEAWSTPEHLQHMRELTSSSWENLDLVNYRGMFNGGSNGAGLERRLVDTDERLQTMDANGVDMHLLSLTSPGVQMFDTETAIAVASRANDRMAEIVHANPTRFAGLGSFAPQDPVRAAREMERCVRELKLNGFIVNSHTQDQYLDEQKFWPILEAAEALDAAIYLHPRCPADSMAGPFRQEHIRAAMWGFAVETGTHGVRLIVSGVFDRFPKLKIVLGHMGENIPFHLWRINHWWEREPEAYGSKLSPIEVFKRNFWITTSGVEHGPALRYAIELLGAERIMWAIDYPYEVMPPAVKFMNEVAINEADRAQIFHRTAETIFHIVPVAI